MAPRDCPWALEYQKAALGTPEFTLGYAHVLANGCEAATTDRTLVQVQAPPSQADARTANKVLAARGLARHGMWQRVRPGKSLHAEALQALMGVTSPAQN